MRCRKHFSDHSSSVGVCASCLRDRLSSLSLNHPIPNLNPKPNPNPNPNPPLVFPRSVSPYNLGRPGPAHILRFFNTPQVDQVSHHRRKKQTGKFGLISKLFRSRSGKSQPSDQAGPTTATTTTSTSLSSYAKGMSPDRSFDEFDSPARSLPRPSPGRIKASPARSGIALCLSPLLRPSPTRQWSFGTVDGGYLGEIRASTAGKSSSSKPHLSGAASFCANRSRKLSDLGRSNWKH